MSMISIHIAAHTAALILAAASAAEARADPQRFPTAGAAVERAFGQLPEEASNAYGDLCLKTKPKGQAADPMNFMPDCTSLLTRRLNEAAQHPVRTTARTSDKPERAPNPSGSGERLYRLPDLPSPAIAAAAPADVVAVLGVTEEALRIDAAAPFEVTAVDLEKPPERPVAAAPAAEIRRKSNVAAQDRPARRQVEPAKRLDRPKAVEEARRTPETRPAPPSAAKRKDPWEEMREARRPDAPGAASSPAPATSAAQRPADERKATLSELAARLISPLTRIGRRTEPTAAPATEVIAEPPSR